MHRSEELTRFYADIIITATEGGTGYWAWAEDYHWSDKEPDTTRVTLRDMEDDRLYAVTLRTISRAFGLLAAREDQLPKHVSPGYAKRLLQAYRERDAGEIDSSDADNIVQIGLFGELVYG